MRELALGDRAAQRFRDLLLAREVVDARGAVLLDPELRAAHGLRCFLWRRRADWRLLDLARFLRCGHGAAKFAARAGNYWSFGLRELASTRYGASIAGRLGLLGINQI